MRIPLAVPIESRAASTITDSRVVNGYIDTQKGIEGVVRRVVKRPGLSSITVTPALPAAAAQGLAFFQSKGWYAALLNNTFYKVTTAGSSTNEGAVAAGHYYFDEIDGQSSGVPYLVFHNGSNGYYYNGATSTLSAITDVNFPTNQTPAKTLAPGICYLDDFIYILDTTGLIWNCANSEDPTTWNALDFIGKSNEPDGGMGIVKHLEYIVAFGLWSGQFFYNNKNPTGSPLEANDTAMMEIGCSNGDSIVRFKTDQTVLWIGQSRETGNGIYMLEGLAPRKISTRAIDEFLNADTLLNVRSWGITIAGHPLYVLTLKDSNYTFVYDLHEKEWYQWTSDNGSGVEGAFTQDFFASFDAQYGNNSSVLLHATSGVLSNISTSVYQDNGVNINFRVVTPRIDFGNNKNKFMFSAEIIGDQAAAGITATLSFSDDDYQTWSTARTLPLSSSRPVIYQLGRFKRRAISLLSTANSALRWEALEVNITQGGSGI